MNLGYIFHRITLITYPLLYLSLIIHYKNKIKITLAIIVMFNSNVYYTRCGALVLVDLVMHQFVNNDKIPFYVNRFVLHESVKQHTRAHNWNDMLELIILGCVKWRMRAHVRLRIKNVFLMILHKPEGIPILQSDHNSLGFLPHTNHSPLNSNVSLINV